MKPIWMILVTVLLSVGLAGGATYYFVNTKATTDKNSLQSQINDLNAKYQDSQAALKSSQADASSAISTTPTSGSTTPSVATGTGTTTTSGVFSLSNLRAADVNIDGATYKLTSGSYTQTKSINLPSSIVLDESNIVLDSSNSEQVAVILKVQYGGNGVSKILEIMGNKGGHPQHISDVSLNGGQVADIQTVTFASNVATIKMLVLGANDPQSSPSVSKTVSYKLTSDSKLVLQ
jgi:hypothetical protein